MIAIDHCIDLIRRDITGVFILPQTEYLQPDGEHAAVVLHWMPIHGSTAGPNVLFLKTIPLVLHQQINTKISVCRERRHNARRPWLSPRLQRRKNLIHIQSRAFRMELRL